MFCCDLNEKTLNGFIDFSTKSLGPSVSTTTTNQNKEEEEEEGREEERKRGREEGEKGYGSDKGVELAWSRGVALGS